MQAILTTLLLASLARAHGNGMDMTMDGAMSLSMGEMLPYLHFTRGDMLWFAGWTTESASSMVGACIGLFLLAIIERWIAACRAVMAAHWSKRAAILRADRMNARGLPSASSSEVDFKQSAVNVRVRDAATLRHAPPFVLAHDLMRGFTYMFHTALQFAFMLTVMTFQAAFILSIIVGLGVGETLFGRYIAHASAHAI